MAKDSIQDRVGQLLGSDSARELAGQAMSGLLRNVGKNGSSGGPSMPGSNNHGGLSGARGVAAGAGAAALAPLAAKGIGKLVKGNGVGSLTEAPKKVVEGAGSKLSDTVGDKVTGKVDEAGGPSGILKDTAKSALPFGGGDGGGGGGGKQDAEGVGQGRRMPVQQSVDVGLPVETVYNQFTQFEDWPKFMHRVTRVSQEDEPSQVTLYVKIWGITRQFTADIETQRPDDRIKWTTSGGMNHTGVVVFRELGPNLTRILLSFDVDPGGLLEKFARGTREVKRAARGDLHRFVAFIEMLEHETGAWRGVIEEGELVEDHDPSYDKGRQYGAADELVHGRGADEEDEDSGSDQEDEDSKSSRSGESGGRSQAGRRGASGSRAQAQRSSSRGSGSSRRTSGSSSGASSASRSSGGSRSGTTRSSRSSKSSSRA